MTVKVGNGVRVAIGVEVLSSCAWEVAAPPEDITKLRLTPITATQIAATAQKVATPMPISTQRGLIFETI
jgi:hypothetical protein